jgi:c-di-GMP-related signal transduction protein
MGLFSLWDALLDVPLADALNEVNIGPSIRGVLLESAPQQDAFSILYQLVRRYEQVDWHTVRDLMRGEVAGAVVDTFLQV